MNAKVIAHEQLLDFSSDILNKAGLSNKDAYSVAKSIVYANLMGIDTHGVMRLPIYCKRVKTGLVNSNPKFIFNKKTKSTGTLNGDNGQGQLVALEAVTKAVNMANETGVGSVAINKSNHFGIAGYYSRKIISNKMIGIIFSNSPSNIVPYGGSKPYFGTNPFSFGFPTETKFPIVVDMATSKVSKGKLIIAKKEGKNISSEWAVDKAGSPTSDIDKALEGGLLPFGGPKGSALALIVSIFSGILTGAKWGAQLQSMFKNFEEPQNFGHFIMALKIDSFIPYDTYKKRINMMIDEIKEIPPAPDFSEVKLPGEIEEETKQQRLKDGIPIGEGVIIELNKLADNFSLKLSDYF